MAFGVLLAGLYHNMQQRNAQRHEDAIREQARQDALKQQAFQNAYETKQQQDTEARNQQTATNENRAARDTELSSGIDPTSGKLMTAAPLPSSITKGPQNSASAPLKEQYAHALAAWKFYASQPPTAQNQQQVKVWQAVAGQLESQIRTQTSADARTADENLRFQHQKELKGTPSYGELHPRSGSSRGGRKAETADADTIMQVEQQLRNSPDPATTAAHLRAQIIMLGGNPKTVEAIDALGRYYAGKKHQVGPTKPKTDSEPL